MQIKSSITITDYLDLYFCHVNGNLVTSPLFIRKTSKTNYRPISVLSVIPKVFEKLQFDQLYSVFTPVFSDILLLNYSALLQKRNKLLFACLVAISWAVGNL